MNEYLQKWIHDLILENDRLKEEIKQANHDHEMLKADFDRVCEESIREKHRNENLETLVKNREETINSLKKEQLTLIRLHRIEVCKD